MLHGTVKKKKFYVFFVFVFMYYWCKKYYNPIPVQYRLASCAGWVPRLTLLDLQIGLNERALGTKPIHM